MTPDPKTPAATSAPPRLAATGLAKQYGHVTALDGISVEFKPGLTGIVGELYPDPNKGT